MEITLVYPLPHKYLFPNNRPRNHGYFGQLVKNRRNIIKWDTIYQIRMAGLKDDMKWKHVHGKILWFTPTVRHPDRDNARSALKSTFDGIQDSGLILDDNYLICDDIVYEKDKEWQRVVITLSEIEGKEN